MPRKFRLFAALMVLLVAAAGWNALAGSTQTGTIKGQVLDQKGEPLPGVAITLRSEAMIRERTTQSDAEGYFFAPALPVGQYRIVATLQGYQTAAVITEVQIDKTTPLKLTMREGEMTEQITVTGAKPVVSKTQTEGSKIVGKKETSNIPVGRSYQALLQFAPGVSGSSNPNMLGGTSNGNQYLTDGVSIRDPVTGTFGANIVFDAIEAVDIKLTGVSAEYGQFQGGLTNLITKSGGNTLTGSLRDTVSQPSWTAEVKSSAKKQYANLPPAEPRTDSSYIRSNRIQTTLGGPIVTDRAWFFLSYDKNQATTSPSTLNGERYRGFFDGDYSILKVTYQMTPEHRIAYFYSRDPADLTREYNFWGGRSWDPRTIDVQGQGGATWIASWSGIWGPSIVSDVKVARFFNEFMINDFADPYPWTNPDQLAAPRFPGGPRQVAPGVNNETGDVYDTHIFSSDPEARKRKQYEGAVTLFLDTKKLGQHTLKVGSDYTEQTVIGSSIIKGDGLFYFEFVRDPREGGAPYDLNNRVYLAKTEFAPPSTIGPKNTMTVLFAQDDWQVNEKLAVNVGLRYEKNENKNDKGEKVISDNSFSPRFGATFDVTGKGEHLVKGTYAQYKAGINLTTLSPFVRAAGGQSAYTLWQNTTPSPGQINWVQTGVVTPDPSTNTWAPNMKPQSINEWTLEYDYSPVPELGVSVKYVNRKWEDITTVRYTYVSGSKLTHIFNNPDAKRDYKAWMLLVDKRFSDNWMVSGSYVRSESKGNVTSDQGFDTFQSFINVPATYVNRFGFLPWDLKDAVKVQGFYQVPLRNERHKITLGGNLNYQTGPVYAKNYNNPGLVAGERIAEFYEPRGSRRGAGFWQADFSGNYTFFFNKRVSFEFRSEVFNFTNNQKVINPYSTWRTNRPNPNFGYPVSWADIQGGRTYRFQFAALW